MARTYFSYSSAFSVLCILVIAPQAAVNGEIVSLQLLTAREGSGTTANPIEECLTTFEGYQKYYLKGAKEDSFFTFNSTSFDECMMKCCTEDRFDCQSFSYFTPLKMCYVMNITQSDVRATLRFDHHWKHYQKRSDVTTFTPETSTDVDEETSPLPSSTTPLTTMEDQTTPAPEATTAAIVTELTKTVSASTSPRIRPTTRRSETVTSVRASQTVSLLPGTDETTVTYGATETTRVLISSSHRGPQTMRNSYFPSTDTIRTICPRTCKNGGECKLFEVPENEQDNGNPEPVIARCHCKTGYTGLFCEQAAQTAGVPVYVIVVAILGSIILILFAAVMITYLLYRKRTGKYRVREQRQRWDKKAATRRAQSFNSLARRSPGGSELSVPGSVNSTATRSTTTSA